MTAKLIIRLYPNQLFDWLLTDNSGQTAASAYQQAELQLPDNLTNITIILLVPSTDVTLTNVSLPKTNRTQLLRALPYAIEECLCEDVEQLHFAIGQWQRTGDEEKLAVAIVAHQKMQAWLAICDKAGIKPQQIIPDIFALPYLPEQWTCTLDQDLLLIRTAQQAGMAIDINNASLLINKLLISNKPQAIIVQDYHHNFSADFIAKPSDIALKINTKPQSFLMTAFNIDNNTINLLQGNYKPATKMFTFSSEWRFTLQLAIAACILLVIAEVASYISLNIENNKLQTQITALSQPIMSGATLDNTSKLSVERQLHLLAQLSKGNNFLELTNKLGASLKQTPGVNIEQINYQNNSLNVRVRADNSQIINNWLTQLRVDQVNIVRANTSQANTAELIIKGD